MPEFKIEDRDNKSGEATRVVNRSHGQPGDMRSFIRASVRAVKDFSWSDKYRLADTVKSKYPNVPIGKINHMIEQERRELAHE